MKNTWKVQPQFWTPLRIALSLLLILPMMGYAQLLSITAIVPFPEIVPINATTHAIFRVTNTDPSSKFNATAINQSRFPTNSGLSVFSSDCGALLHPGEFCTITLSLNASQTQSISTALKFWAKPTASGVQYPINITITPNLPQITLQATKKKSSSLPALRDPVIASNGHNWLIVSASTSVFHDFTAVLQDITVYDTDTGDTSTLNIQSSDLPDIVKNQLLSTDQEFLQDGNTLYIIGGFYSTDGVHFTTLNTITAIDVPGLIAAVIAQSTHLSSYVNYRTDIPQFKVTGGQLGKIGNDFYLAYGQDCEGNYCATSQVYTNAIYQFQTNTTLSSVNIINTVRRVEDAISGWRRRDYTLAPFISYGFQTLLALGGPFTPGEHAAVWRNAINVGPNIFIYNNHFITQQANQYLAGHLSLYSQNSRTSYVATLSGLSNLFWGLHGLNYDITAPYGNILDLISSDPWNNAQEFANIQPVCSTNSPVQPCGVYMGLGATFIPITNAQYYDARGILQLDQLPAGQATLVGYLYGGLLSVTQVPFTDKLTTVTKDVYEVYVTPPAAANEMQWQNITDFRR
jgi:hypothetical protein